MREYIVPTLFLSVLLPVSAQTVPAGWSILKEAKEACQIAVPPDWAPFTEATGVAVFHDATTGIAVVTSQPGQLFKPLSEVQLKMLGVAREKVFENSAKRVFYQDKTAKGSEDSNAYSAMVPGRDGTCSCHVVFAHGIAEEIARKITLSLGPATAENKPQQ
jgi:hypothetical protein